MRWLVLAAVLAGSAAQAQAPPKLEPVASAMQEIIDRGELAGAVTIATKDGKLVHLAVQGKKDLASGEPLQRDTLFRAYSMTKPVMAVAMMILRDEGKWAPDDPITRFLPEMKDLKVFKGLDAQGQPILEPVKRPPTMRELMTHTAGFSYGFTQEWVDLQYNAAGLGTATSPDDYVRKVAALPLAYEPGSQWRYSISMDLEGRILERITGQSLPEFMQARIFGPLKMTDTAFHVPADKAARLATFYEWNAEAKRLEPARYGGRSDPSSPPAVASGGGGLYATADDYLRFGRMLLQGGELDGARIISRAAAKEMMTSQISPQIVTGHFGIGFQQIRPGYEYGYNGVVVTDPKAAGVALGKGSYLWDGAGMTWFWVDPTNRVVFVGMVQRRAAAGAPLVQPISQQAMTRALGLR